MRQNILNDKWFIKFNVTGNSVESSGRILGEASDGWFYVEIVYSSGATTKRVLPVGELESARFFNSDTEMLEIERSFEKPLLQRKRGNL